MLTQADSKGKTKNCYTTYVAHLIESDFRKSVSKISFLLYILYGQENNGIKVPYSFTLTSRIHIHFKQEGPLEHST